MKSDFEVFLRKIADKGKTGIRLPMKEKDAQKQIEGLKQLFEKGMLSEETYNEAVKKINSRSLDEEMYREFYYFLSPH